jgi:hypothetical protein
MVGCSGVLVEMYFSAKDKGEMMSMIYNWPSEQVCKSKLMFFGIINFEKIHATNLSLVSLPPVKLDVQKTKNLNLVCFFQYKTSRKEHGKI